MRDQQFILLATAITNRERIHNLIEHDPQDIFTHPETVSVFEAIRELIDDGKDPDFATVAIRLQEKGGEKAQSIISELSMAGSTINYDSLLLELVRNNRLKKIKAFCEDLSLRIKDGLNADTAAKMLAEFQDKLLEPARDVSTSVRQLADASLDDVFAQIRPLRTGITEIDEYLPGLFPGDLIAVAARPGMGKSSLAWQIAANIPGTVLYYSLEMKALDLYARLLSAMASVENWRIKTAKLDDGERSRLIEAQDRLRRRRGELVVVDKVFNINSIINSARQVSRKGKLSAIFIDYLQLVGGGRGENQNYRIADCTRKLKEFAMEHEIPVIVLSQLSRDCEKQNRKPVLADLRDSGAIEQDLDTAVFIHKNDENTQLIISKQRNGRTGTIDIFFDAQFTRFGAKHHIANNRVVH